MRNKNPYQGVNWASAPQVLGCTHMHCIDNRVLRQYVRMGLRFATLSNYYPSAPYYPLREVTRNGFKVGRRTAIRDGEWMAGGVDFNAEIAKWRETLSPEAVAQLPFDDGEKIFSDIPEDLLEAPNAEHHSFAECSSYLHITAPGATLASGTFDRFGEFKLAEHGFRGGYPKPWRVAFREILNTLIVPDGGGIIINHPTWSHLPLSFILEMLDSDDRVLGIEVYNHNCSTDFTAFSESLWDMVLATGRQCFGFFTKDHPVPPDVWKGKIFLLPEEYTAESCLRALRRGRFYGAIMDNGLRFEYLDFDGEKLRAKCNRPVFFQVISARGVEKEGADAKQLDFTVAPNTKREMVFLRLTAREGREEEKLYSQPFMLM